MDLQSKVTNFYMTLKGRPPTYREAREYLEEEFDELLAALTRWEEGDEDETIEHIAKEIGDAAFTLVAIADAVGVDYEEAAGIVAEDNLTNKVPTKTGKIRKKAGYVPPSMKRAVL